MHPADDPLEQAIARQVAAYLDMRIWSLDDALLGSLVRAMTDRIEHGSRSARDCWVRLAALGRVMAARFPDDPTPPAPLPAPAAAAPPHRAPRRRLRPALTHAAITHPED